MRPLANVPWRVSSLPVVGSMGASPKPNEKQIREIKTLLTDPAAQVKDIAERYGVPRSR